MYRIRHASVSCRGLKENVAALPSPTGVKRITFPSLSHTIDPMPGKMASVAIYSYLSDKHDGKLTKKAAQEALDLYAEVSPVMLSYCFPCMMGSGDMQRHACHFLPLPDLLFSLL